jgi:hypothetical protein
MVDNGSRFYRSALGRATETRPIGAHNEAQKRER